MISFGPMSITLLICAVQGIALALLLLAAKRNRTANRYLALQILATAALTTPYIIGYAGFYDKWPWISFAPFSYTLAFGPLIYFYTISLVDASAKSTWPHFAPVALQFLADALVFPLPLKTKNWWDGIAYAPIISPIFEGATLLSITVYCFLSYRRYLDYRRWLDDNRTDGVDFDPAWVRNFLIALAAVAVIWLGFAVANWLNPARDYFDQFWLYVTFSALVLYLGIAGWRHSETAFPSPIATVPQPRPETATETSIETGRDWAGQGRLWLSQIDQCEYWRDPELTLASLARQLGTNTAYLSRGLNAASGENFNAVINRRRVVAIQRDLASQTEGRDLLSLALDAGFGSKASFNRAFADFAGMSPTAWRLKSQKTQSA